MLHSTIPYLLFAATGVLGVQLPNLTGQYPVGTINLELIDYSRNDPFAPTPQLRDLMVSVYYPTTDSIVKYRNYSFAPYMSAATAASLSTFIGTSNDVPNIIKQSYLNAPIRSNEFPVLIFSPGFGGSRNMYVTLLEDLASQGWILVAVDHPYDTTLVEYPDGRSVSTLSSLLDGFPSQMPRAIAARVLDVKFVADSLKNSTVLAQIPGLTDIYGGIDTLRSNHAGILGHSLGGATAAQAVANFSTFACGVDLDGGIYGPVATSGLSQPFLQIEAEDHDFYNDTTFSDLYKHETGFRRMYQVNGTVHLSFTDFGVLRGLLGNVKIPETSSNLTQFGTINGERLMEIETAYIDSFFSYCFKGRSVDVLDNLAHARFPEVSIPLVDMRRVV